MNRSTYVIILGIALLGIIACGYVFRRIEPFEENIDPEKLLARVKGILEKIDNPELISHVLSIVDKDPGQLARMQIASTK
jgi:hypothetical protein